MRNLPQALQTQRHHARTTPLVPQRRVCGRVRRPSVRQAISQAGQQSGGHCRTTIKPLASAAAAVAAAGSTAGAQQQQSGDHTRLPFRRCVKGRRTWRFAHLVALLVLALFLLVERLRLRGGRTLERVEVRHARERIPWRVWFRQSEARKARRGGQQPNWTRQDRPQQHSDLDTAAPAHTQRRTHCGASAPAIQQRRNVATYMQCRSFPWLAHSGMD